ncbi:hypothetical protein QN358_14225, partial [Subtercola sp. RTI3]|nr:hypothetical protein [Subtercola sp. RTI3]
MCIRDRDTAGGTGTGVRLLVVGKANHLTPWVVETIGMLRASGTVVVVDMGWPSLDRQFADIATFGASAAVGGALRALLGDAV